MDLDLYGYRPGPPPKAWKNKAIYETLRAAKTGMTVGEVARAIGIKVKRFSFVKGRPNPGRYVSTALYRLYLRRKLVRIGHRDGKSRILDPYRYSLRPDDPDGVIFWQNLEQ
jgi:hypothetical protein